MLLHKLQKWNQTNLDLLIGVYKYIILEFSAESLI